MQPTSEQIDRLRAALLDAFPTIDELTRWVHEDLGQNIEQIVVVHGRNLTQISGDLCWSTRWCNQQHLTQRRKGAKKRKELSRSFAALRVFVPLRRNRRLYIMLTTTQISDDLVSWAAAKPNGIHDPLGAALQRRPINSELTTIAADWADIGFEVLPLPPTGPTPTFYQHDQQVGVQYNWVYSKSVGRGEAFAESCYMSRAIVRMPRPYTMSDQLILNTPNTISPAIS